MQRTSITIKPTLLQTLNKLATDENRPLSNLIETILIRYLAEAFFVDDFEMDEIRQDTALQKNIKSSLKEYKKKQGQFV
ncbi:MAG: Helix-turn-helix protein, CopG [uncultured bacterium]|nr:MAG: Helix-turn-helix protein, CopG [uncultured bacterium]HLD45382.1 CopG family transcriptional regulator [bacterium]